MDLEVEFKVPENYLFMSRNLAMSCWNIGDEVTTSEEVPFVSFIGLLAN